MTLRTGVCTLGILCALLSAGPVRVQQPALRAVPAAGTVAPGEPFTVTVQVGSAEVPVAGLYGLGFQLHFDPAVFQVTGLQAGDLFAPYLAGLSPRALELKRLEAALGYVAYAVTLTAPPAVDGHGAVAVIQMQARAGAAAGTYPLALKTVEANDAAGADLPLTIEDGAVQVAAPATAPPVPVSPAQDARQQPLSLVLQWQGVAGATAYDVQVAPSAAFDARAVDRRAVAGTTLAIDGLDHRTTYYWRVRTSDGGPWSAVFHFTTVAPLPGVPQPVAPADEAGGVGLAPVLRWRAVDEAARYDLQVAHDATFSALVEAPSGVTDTTWATAGLDHGATYYWRVRAVGEGGTGGWSEAFRFTTRAAAPQAPALLAPVDGARLTGREARLQWAAVAGATRYHVQLATNAALAGPLYDDTTRTQTALLLTALPADTTCYWRVRAYGAGGWGAWSAAARFSVAPPSGTGTETPEGALPAEVVLGPNYPNPFNPATTIRFALPAAAPVTLAVYDLAGRRVVVLLQRQVLPAGWHDVVFEAASLPSGPYVAVLQAGSRRETRPMMLLK